jgi:hypothetical protein
VEDETDGQGPASLNVAVISVSAQQSNLEEKSAQRSRHQGTTEQQSRKVQPTSGTACDPLTKMGLVMDKLYGNPVDEILAAIEGIGQKPDLPAVDVDADLPHRGDSPSLSSFGFAVGLVGAVHQFTPTRGWRADSFAKLYRSAAAPPVDSSKCSTLGGAISHIPISRAGLLRTWPTCDDRY